MDGMAPSVSGLTLQLQWDQLSQISTRYTHNLNPVKLIVMWRHTGTQGVYMCSQDGNKVLKTAIQTQLSVIAHGRLQLSSPDVHRKLSLA